MHLTCRTCGNHFIIKSRGWMDQWLPRACCGPCFRSLMYREGNIKIFVNGTTIVPYTETKGARSGFEETFSALCKENGISVMHEPLKFRLSDKSMYVPDFLLYPAAYGSGQHGPFVEVKGLWTTEGKRKFLMFTKEYPEFKIFLVDKEMLSILKKGHYETK